MTYKHEKFGIWYVLFHCYYRTGINCRKAKRGFKTKREMVERKYHLRIKETDNLETNQLRYNM